VALPYFNDEMGAAVGAGFATADGHPYGPRALRRAAYWPEHADEPFGDVIKKYVVSNSLQATSGRTRR
jgi:hypothetical protein